MNPTLFEQLHDMAASLAVPVYKPGLWWAAAVTGALAAGLVVVLVTLALVQP